MKFQEMTDKHSNYISAYEENWVKIKNNTYKKSILIFSDEIIQIDSLSQKEIVNLTINAQKKKNLELVIIASKRNIELNKLDAYSSIIESQLGCEFMNLDSGYRTFNIILSESREVALLVRFN